MESLSANPTRRHSGEEFGLDRVKSLFTALPTAGAQALCSSILKAAGEFGAEAPICDDRTALALIRTA